MADDPPGNVSWSSGPSGQWVVTIYFDLLRRLGPLWSAMQGPGVALRSEMEELRSSRDRVLEKVRTEKNRDRSMRRLPQLAVWTKSVREVEDEVKAILQEQGGVLRFPCRCYRFLRRWGQQDKELEQRISISMATVKRLKEDGSNFRVYVTNSSTVKDKMHQLNKMKKDLWEDVVVQLEQPGHVPSEKVRMWKCDAEKVVEKLNLSFCGVKNDGNPIEILRMALEIEKLFLRRMDLKTQELTIEELIPFHHLPEDPSFHPSDFVNINSKYLSDIETWLDSNDVWLIGIHGMAGIGKTTLAKTITKKLQSSGGLGYNLVISVVVSENLSISRIQAEILAQLGYSLQNSKVPTEECERVNFISRMLSDYNFLLVLDDVWESFDLTKTLGIPSSSFPEEKKRKVILTSRSEEVCKKMSCTSAQQLMKVGSLDFALSCNLFFHVVGRDTICNPGIRNIAENIVNKCGGLPLLLKTIAGTMAGNKRISHWMTVEEYLSDPLDDNAEIEDVYVRLKVSFDRLPTDRHRICLLYCAMFPEDYDIPIDEIMLYLVAEGHLNKKHKIREESRLAIITTLQQFNLLESGSSNEHVKLHDVVRGMLIWITNKWEGKSRKLLIRAGGKVWHKHHSVDKDWEGVDGVSLMDNPIEELSVNLDHQSTSKELRVQILLMDGNPLMRLPDEFPGHFFSLLILNLSGTSIQRLPKSIGSLKSLRYLNLSSSMIEEIPVEVGELSNLLVLLLCVTRHLKRIPRLAILPLKKLQCLYLHNSSFWEQKHDDQQLRLEDINGLCELVDVGITIGFTGDAEKFLASDILRRSTSILEIEGVRDVTVDTICKIGSKLENLREIYVRRCNLVGVLELDGDRFKKLEEFCIHVIPRKDKASGSPRLVVPRGNAPLRILNSIHIEGQMSCLVKLYLWGGSYKHLAWLPQLPNLRILILRRCSALCHLLSESEVQEELPLMKLEYMVLRELPLLNSLSGNNLSFPCLTRMNVNRCPKLRKLSISSCNSVKTEITCPVSWWTKLQWEGGEHGATRFITKFVGLSSRWSSSSIWSRLYQGPSDNYDEEDEEMIDDGNDTEEGEEEDDGNDTEEGEEEDDAEEYTDGSATSSNHGDEITDYTDSQIGDLDDSDDVNIDE